MYDAHYEDRTLSLEKPQMWLNSHKLNPSVMALSRMSHLNSPIVSAEVNTSLTIQPLNPESYKALIPKDHLKTKL